MCFLREKYNVFSSSYETQRQGPDHQCGPIKVRGQIDLCGPKVPLSFFVIQVKKYETSFEVKQSLIYF